MYSLPPGSTVTNGDTSDAADVNTPLADLEADMNIPRPIVAGGTGASSASAALVNLGLTATAAEINVLDGITATVAELNYVDGVTSAIQTQLDAKMASASYPTLTSLEGLTLAEGDILYATAADTLARLAKGTAGQGLIMNAGATAPAWDGPGYTWVAAATNGAAVYDVGSIPAWVSDIVCTFNDVSLATTSDASVIQVGTGGSPASSGYSTNTATISHAISTAVTANTTGFVAGSSQDTISGHFRLLRRSGSNEWVLEGGVRRTTSSVAAFNVVAGRINLGGALDIVRLTRSGASNFNGGTFAVGYK